VTTLASRPPVPMLFEAEASAPVRPRRPRPRALPDGLRGGDARPAERRIAARRWLWIPAAAAALVLAATLVWKEIRAGNSFARGVFPQAEELRGGLDAGPLYFPRERVLRDGDHLWSSIEFEIAPSERATGYRVELSRVGGGAFDPGSSVETLRSQEPRIQVGRELGGRLEPSRYTWEATATIDGLDVVLGKRDFEVVADAGLLSQLGDSKSSGDSKRDARVLALLHERGFTTDARAYARTMPQSPERDAYLARMPGR
jgi:hypothetical protein